MTGWPRPACQEVEPKGWPGEQSRRAIVAECFPSQLQDHFDKKEKKWTRTSLPISISVPRRDKPTSMTLMNWTDGSSRPLFKLYSGNRSAHSIAGNMLKGKRQKATRSCPDGKVESKGLCQLWQEKRAQLINAPLDVLCSMGGSFNFDPRGGWTALDAGFSPDQQSKSGLLTGSPHPQSSKYSRRGDSSTPDQTSTRPDRFVTASGRAWSPPMLARAAMSGVEVVRPFRRFRFTLALSGKNKVVTFATEELDT